MQRRTILTAAAAATLAGFTEVPWYVAARPAHYARAADAPPRPRIAAVFSELRFRSHAYNILENFYAPYFFCGELVDPGCDVVSWYVDQFPADDMAREAAARLKTPIFRTIDEALCVGGKELAVDGVLMIGEHGNYLVNEAGVREYPRKLWFDQCLRTMRRSGRFVPLFNDKHFSYRFDWAKEMVDEARAVGMPLMGGSSVPLAERKPKLELPKEAVIEEAISIHGGGVEVYDFHAFDVLQSFVEDRPNTRSGVASVEFFDTKGVTAAAAAGRWSPELFAATMAVENEVPVTRQARPPLGTRPQQIREESEKPAADTSGKNAAPRINHAVSVTYRDGLKATMFAVGSSSNRWHFGCKLQGENEPRVTTLYNGPWGNRGLFKALSHAIQRLYIERREPWPAERTLLTTGLTAAAVRAKVAPGKPLETPELAIEYRTTDWRGLAENGATWEKITFETEQPKTFEPGDARLVGR